MGKRLEERIFLGLMVAAVVIVVGSLVLILATVVVKGLPALNLAMLTQVPQGGYYLGKEGGILNAITGSLALASGATLLSFFLSLPVVLYLQLFARDARFVHLARLSLDVLWGVPSIVYGAFGFTLLLLLGLRASLLGGIIALALLELPILVRAMEEVMSMVPFELKEASYALGAHRRRSLGALHRWLHRPAADVTSTPRRLTAAGRLLPTGHPLPGGATASLRLGTGPDGHHSRHQPQRAPAGPPVDPARDSLRACPGQSGESANDQFGDPDPRAKCGLRQPASDPGRQRRHPGPADHGHHRAVWLW